jgi:hypothetical protein
MGLSAQGDAARVDQFTVADRLEHVAGRSRLERLEQVRLPVVHGEHQHAHPGEASLELARGLQSGHPRHRDVEDREVGARLERLANRLVAI